MIIDTLAFETPEFKGHKIAAWYLKEPKHDCLVKILKSTEVVREFTYPGYKVWNLAAHAEEIIESEIAKNSEGYRCAGSDGLGGCVMPKPVANSMTDSQNGLRESEGR